MKTSRLLTITFAALLSLSMVTISEARGYHGYGRGSHGHRDHGNLFSAVRFEGKVFNRLPTEEERLSRSLQQAISRFQGSDGLRDTGALDGSPLNALEPQFSEK